MPRILPVLVLWRWPLRAGFLLLAFAAQFSHVPRTTNDVFALPVIGIEKSEAQPIPRSSPGIPTRLLIPAIHVDAPIDPVGLLPSGQLDVPPVGERVGWYRLNARPGGIGNAVLDGHLDLAGKPGVFWRLRNLSVGHELTVVDDAGKARVFRVVKTAVYHVDDAPMEEIFGTTKRNRLNLITCAGVWRKELNHYDRRLIVYTELVDERAVSSANTT